MSDEYWGKPEFQSATGSYISWKNVGDKVTGVVTRLGVGKDFNDEDCPELIIDVDGEAKTLTAGQRNLQTVLRESAPKVGQKITIEFTGVAEEFRNMKLFKVTLGDAAPVGDVV